MKLNGSQILIETLLEQGTDTIFGYPGGAVLNIYDELYKYSDRMHHVLTAHEQGASHAADGYARATGKVGVCLATSGPGATNLVTGIATAYMDSIPMVAITGNVGTSFIGRDSFQEVYIAGITMPITKHNFVVRKVEELADTVRLAFEIAMSGRPGPVLIDIPKDVTAAVCEFEHKPAVQPRPHPQIQHEQIKKMADMINASERPVIFFGGGVITSGASDLLEQLIHRADIPTCHAMMGIGALKCDDPLNMGMIGMHGWVSAGRAVDKADLLIALGTRFSDRVATKMGDFATSAKIVQVDIDPAEVNKNIEVDHNVIGDARDVLEAVLPLIDHADHTPWKEQIATWKKRMDYRPKDDDSVIRPHQLMKKINELLDKDDIVATDVGQHQMWAAQFTGREKPRTFLSSGGLGTMGYGYGAAIGAQVACPNRKVVHITGDGSFHMNLQEMCTAVSYHLPVVTVIVDNAVLGMVRQWQTSFYGHRYSNTDPHRKTDFVKLAEAFGAKGIRCKTLAEFEAALREALKADGPVIIDAIVDKDERVLPFIPAGQTINNVVID
ncbi:biosynthetic-type acetolactate synthase large subunit [Butyricicoccus porcorum]|uniref:Acetolactate synthase n=1 Tax=Butyricicoccus porcorum TaxID=1945634 RepID=A0A252F5E2_9FIRM|nr:biosynthetic-type acetolactate synthase large subunit [Butyricicoccus porcorum]MCI6926886.1 biosynthetic-type acetolactate synthase large subunit [Butyricicoccus porcorum]MDD6985725.1 biosynthetic-type acetolactate synthase large subunit [Butyricicoccus porcorum]OUM20976.1 acetolactate synthase, large subunit, biosynthetic type [Butyricicoccus porcorum]